MRRAWPLPTYAAGQVATPRHSLERSSLLHYLMMVYLFLFCSRLQEFFPQVRLSALIGYGLLGVVALTMRAGQILRMPTGKILIAFTSWVAFCLPFSSWIGGSFDYLRTSIQGMIVVVLMTALITTTRELFRAMYVVGLATGMVALMSLVAGRSVTDRLVVGKGGTLGDPNFYCLYLLVGLPFLWMGLVHECGWRRFLPGLLIVPVLAAAAATGSRGGLVAFAAGLVAYFFFVPLRQKVLLIIGCSAALVIAAATLPDHIRSRFTTFFSSENGTDSVAVASARARKALFLRSIQLTIEHPLVGVGPGMFMVAENELAQEEGRAKGAWHVTHNTYTQLSSELGIPGALLFMTVLVWSYTGLSPIRKRGATKMIRDAAVLLQVCFVIVAVSAVFLSLGYGGLLYVLIGLSGVFRMLTSAAPAAGVSVPTISRGVAMRQNYTTGL